MSGEPKFGVRLRIVHHVIQIWNCGGTALLMKSPNRPSDLFRLGMLKIYQCLAFVQPLSKERNRRRSKHPPLLELLEEIEEDSCVAIPDMLNTPKTLYDCLVCLLDLGGLLDICLPLPMKLFL